MATRKTRTRGQKPRRRWLRLVAICAVGFAVVWAVPIVLVETPLRDAPLTMALAGIDGQISSRGAIWNWTGPIEYRSITLADRTGRIVAAIPQLTISRGLLGLGSGWLWGGPLDLGTIRVVGGEALIEVRPGGSSLEDILAPWLAAMARPAAAPEAPASSPGVVCELEVIDAAVELVDLPRDDSWRITDVLAAVTLRPPAGDGAATPAAATVQSWTAAGRVMHAGRPSAAVVIDEEAASAEPVPADRTAITAGATAALARDGGWSVSAPVPAAGGPQTLAVAANRLPLGISSVAATRLMATRLLDGLADARLDIVLPQAPVATTAEASAPPLAVAGSVAVSQLALCAADTLAELATIDRCEVPLDLVVAGDTITIRDLRAISPLFKAEASGRLRIPGEDSWQWGEALVGENFAVAAEVDLAAAARAIPGGITVRPDVKVTGGGLQLTAAARPDGKDRVLEVRVTSRDLAAIQYGVDGERPLRWSEPFTAWLRGRRGPGRRDRLRVEEARIASPAVELAATGTADASTVQWSVDIDKLMAEAKEVLDIKAVSLQGAARGTLSVSRLAATGASTAQLSAAFSGFSYVAAGRPTWADKDITIEAEATGSRAGAAWLIDSARAQVTADGDTLETTLAGGAIVDPQALLAAMAGSEAAGGAAWVRTAPDADMLAVECTVAGDLGRWQTRGEAVAGASGVAVGGSLKAGAAVAARGDAWQITRANLEIEKLSAEPARGSWQIKEPRLVATAAGLVDPARGIAEVSSAEVLTATLSLRTGGATVMLPAGAAGSESVSLIDRVRGKVQWQADVGRLEKWAVAPATAARWPASGRAWGTAEVLDTPAGVNLLVEVTGNQLVVARGGTGTPLAGAATPPQPVWMEPRAGLVVEVTHPRGVAEQAAAGIMINRLALDSSTLGLAATGSIREAADRPMVELAGTVSYDWSQLSRLFTPWTGGGVQMVGGGPRPFAVRGPVGIVALASRADSTAAATTVPVPESWLGEAAGAGRRPAGRTITLPVAAVGKPPAVTDWLREVSLTTSTTWAAADLGGIRLDPGEMNVRLFEGQLALGPFDIGAAGGRIRGAPWIKLLPLPGELVMPPGRMAERVLLTPEMCNRWVRWVVPLLGKSTSTQGLVSIDVAGGRIPLGDPFGGELSGQLLFERLEVTPSGAMQPLVNLIVKLQSVIDPRFVFGDKAVLLSVRPEPVQVRLAQRRLWHDGLVMDSGQLSIRTKGSVGGDGSLDMIVELAFRGDLAGQTPVITKLLQTPLVIPLRGTVSRPQFDAGQIDSILGRIVENTAEAVISDGLSRGLEALFGK
jgi:translocation and assembly module TamB